MNEIWQGLRQRATQFHYERKGEVYEPSRPLSYFTQLAKEYGPSNIRFLVLDSRFHSQSYRARVLNVSTFVTSSYLDRDEQPINTSGVYRNGIELELSVWNSGYAQAANEVSINLYPRKNEGHTYKSPGEAENHCTGARVGFDLNLLFKLVDLEVYAAMERQK